MLKVMKRKTRSDIGKEAKKFSRSWIWVQETLSVPYHIAREHDVPASNGLGANRGLSFDGENDYARQ